MKSSYELAMERLRSNDSTDRKVLTDAQKAEISDIDQKYTAKAAERQIFLKKQIAEAEVTGKYEEVVLLQKQLRSELDVIEEDKEAAKEKIRNS
jgi:hypothetical protein